jgi:hypothetical protein
MDTRGGFDKVLDSADTDRVDPGAQPAFEITDENATARVVTSEWDLGFEAGWQVRDRDIHRAIVAEALFRLLTHEEAEELAVRVFARAAGRDPG